MRLIIEKEEIIDNFIIMNFEHSHFNTPRVQRQTCPQSQSIYKIQPWSQSTSQLPFIIINSRKLRKSAVDGKDKKQRIGVFYSHQKCKQRRDKSSSLERNTVTNVFSQGKFKKPSKYDSNIYRTKTIKNFDIMQEDSQKIKLRKKLSKKLIFKRDNKGLPEISPSSFSTHPQTHLTTKAEKRLQLQRKIFMMLSRDKL